MEHNGANYKIKLYRNPYGHSVTDEQLMRVLRELAEERATEIQSRYEAGKYKRNSMGFAILDPTAPLQKKSDETLLATIVIGPEGPKYEVNGLTKAITHRDYGMDCGVPAHTQKHRLPDGSFKWGYSVDINGTIVGASGLLETEDRYQGNELANGFNCKITDLRTRWEADNPGKNWWCNFDKPLGRFTEILEKKPRLTI